MLTDEQLARFTEATHDLDAMAGKYVELTFNKRDLYTAATSAQQVADEAVLHFSEDGLSIGLVRPTRSVAGVITIPAMEVKTDIEPVVVGVETSEFLASIPTLSTDVDDIDLRLNRESRPEYSRLSLSSGNMLGYCDVTEAEEVDMIDTVDIDLSSRCWVESQDLKGGFGAVNSGQAAVYTFELVDGTLHIESVTFDGSDTVATAEVAATTDMPGGARVSFDHRTIARIINGLPPRGEVVMQAKTDYPLSLSLDADGVTMDFLISPRLGSES